MKADEQILEIMEGVAAGDIPPASAAASVRSLTARVEDLGFANVDLEREARTGFPEVVYGGGKEPQQVAQIAETVFAHSGAVLVTRTNEEAFALVRERIPDATYNSLGRLIFADSRRRRESRMTVGVVAAGTSDLPVAEEAAMTATIMGCKVSRLNDVGVAGLHRLLSHVEKLRSASVLVVVAGMEGALPSVVAGLVSAPVIAVPTSVGYGANLGGIAALLTMLNSCSAGVTVVNIDNGFAAGYTAALIASVHDQRKGGTDTAG